MKKIISKFYCIQPIYIEEKLLLNMYKANINLKQLINDTQLYCPEWKINMDNFNKLYNSTICIDCSNIFNGNDFKKNIKETEFLFFNSIELSKYLIINETNVYLFFDYRLMQFTIIFELSFLLPIDIMDNILTIDEEQKDFYNLIRGLFVKENDNSILPIYIKDFYSCIIDKIINYINNNFSIITSSDSLRIINNTGNITNTIIADEIQQDLYIKYAKKIFLLNKYAERISNIILIELNNLNNIDIDTVYYTNLYCFAGRFHSIVLYSKKDKIRYIPIQFQMQFLWFFLSKQINPILEKYQDELVQNDSIKNIENYTDKLDLIINKVEILNFYNQKFKLSIEADNSIFDKIERTWNIENMLKSSNSYIIFFKDYLKRLYTKKTSKNIQRQNKILFFLALIQFVALMSVWSDYLSLISTNYQNRINPIMPLFFNKYQIFEIFNAYILPIGFISIIIYLYNKNM